MKAINRIDLYLTKNSINRKEFELKVGLSNGYVATQIKRGGDIGETILKKVMEAYPDLTITYLLYGFKL